MTLPKYQSHKIVEAVKIHAIKSIKEAEELGHQSVHTSGWILFWHDSSRRMNGRIYVTKEWHTKHEPREGGYFIRYPDGYESYSPADSFEEGYTLYEEGKELRGQTNSVPYLDDGGFQSSRLHTPKNTMPTYAIPHDQIVEAVKSLQYFKMGVPPTLLSASGLPAIEAPADTSEGQQRTVEG